MINIRTVNIELYHKRIIQDLLGEPYVSAPPTPEAAPAKKTEGEDDGNAMEDLALSKGAADIAEAQNYPSDSGVEKVYNADSNGKAPEQESPSVSLKRGRSPSVEEGEDVDSRYGQAKRRRSSGKGKVALDFVSDDDASDGVRMVAVAVSSSSYASDSDGA